MYTRFYLLSTTLIGFLVIVACEATPDPALDRQPTAILSQLSALVQLPDGQIAVSPDSQTFALYTEPNERYGHGILGDAIEAGQLLVVQDGSWYRHTLGEAYVFEDLQPRLADVTGDGKEEIITIRSQRQLGAGIAIYQVQGDSLTEYAYVPEIGRSFRWLNPVAIFDLDGDDTLEIAWIQTPHIGGILKVAKIQPGQLRVLDEVSQYTNHAIGQRNLCLSALALENDTITCYVPTQARDRIVGFRLINNQWVQSSDTSFEVNMSVPLLSQFSLPGLVILPTQCITP